MPTGSLVNGSVFISNVGDVGSMLGWEVLSFPNDWGSNWTIRWRRNDQLATFEGGYVGTNEPEEVFVQVLAPDEKNGNFSGEIVLVNVDDPTDTCTINLVCKTPRSRELHQVYYLIEILCERFPILHYLL